MQHYFAKAVRRDTDGLLIVFMMHTPSTSTPTTTPVERGQLKQQSQDLDDWSSTATSEDGFSTDGGSSGIFLNDGEGCSNTSESSTSISNDKLEKNTDASDAAKEKRRRHVAMLKDWNSDFVGEINPCELTFTERLGRGGSCNVYKGTKSRRVHGGVLRLHSGATQVDIRIKK